ncbi:Proline-rich protein OS=Streptomyces antimycoticus OX=68175 GN=SSPO_055000 PE=4 SV=1 [Streptomyces antimycoticus]
MAFDVIELPAVAGWVMLRRVPRTGPVAVDAASGGPGQCHELPGLLDWLEWGGVALDLGAIVGRRITAPCPSRSRPPLLDAGAPGERGPQEAAVWLRPPDPKGEVSQRCRGQASGAMGAPPISYGS